MLKHHLTDNCTVADLTLDTYEVGGVINNGICSGKGAFEGSDMTYDEVHGVVVRTTNEGVLLQPFGDTCGRVPKSRTGVEPV